MHKILTPDPSSKLGPVLLAAAALVAELGHEGLSLLLEDAHENGTAAAAPSVLLHYAALYRRALQPAPEGEMSSNDQTAALLERIATNIKSEL